MFVIFCCCFLGASAEKGISAALIVINLSIFYLPNFLQYIGAKPKKNDQEDPVSVGPSNNDAGVVKSDEDSSLDDHFVAHGGKSKNEYRVAGQVELVELVDSAPQEAEYTDAMWV